MKPWINYHHLYYFMVIAEEGMVSRAAQKLRLGQPTLSAQLRQFEESLGIQLFERRNKRLVLTEHGRVALDYAKNIFRIGSEMYEVLHDRLKPLKPTLHLGALDSVPKQVILRTVETALKFATCQITLAEGKQDELIRELSAHRCDLVLTNFLPVGVEARGLFPRRIARNHVGLYGSPAFRGLRRKFPESVSAQPMIVPTYDSKLRYDLDHWAKLHGVELNIITESQDVSVKKLMAIKGLGLMPAAPHTVSRQVAAGELLEIGVLQGVSEELFLVAAERKIPNAVAAKVFQSLSI